VTEYIPEKFQVKSFYFINAHRTRSEDPPEHDFNRLERVKSVLVIASLKT